ncbi:MAG: DUF2807 domain-containing protein [Spirochaetales bacterium]|nr:DUF2807 domain-containing protein [Spirochaetales bacterium]
MKNSGKFFWLVLGGLILIPIICLISFKAVVFHSSRSTGDIVVERKAPGKLVKEDYDFTNFNSIEVVGGWKIDVSYGEEFSIQAKYHENYADDLLIEKRGQTLYVGLANPDKKQYSMHKSGAYVSIVMPKIDYVDVEGGVDMNLENYNSDNIQFRIQGAGQIIGNDCNFERLSLYIDGAGNFNFYDSRLTNADVNVSGAANIEINMNGGALTGNLSGIAHLGYTGDVSRIDVSKDGMSIISKEDE